MSSKKQKKSKDPLMEQKLMKWLEIVRVWKFPVTKGIIQVKALEIFTKLHENEENKEKFRASNGSFQKFARRHEIRSLKIVGESGSSKVKGSTE